VRAKAIAAVLASLFVLGGAGATYQSVATRRALRRYPPPGTLVDVGGRRLHLVCRGHGAPTVVLEASGPGTVLQYANVQSALAGTRRVCAYDRAGLGWSEPSPNPTAAEPLARDLETLLEHAAIPPPYVFAASSAGGLTIELYARRHPDRVAGLVWIDGLTGEIVEDIPELGRLAKSSCAAAAASRLGLVRLFDPLGLRRLPEHQGDRTAALMYQSEAFDTVCSATRSFALSAAQIRNAPPISSAIPVVVLVHDEPRGVDPTASAAELAAVEPRWRRGQESFARRFLHAKLVVARRTGHLIASERPDLVVDAIHEVQRLGRQGSPP
jgi:pimeloyl-ACP methyl ester carboxylesterase